MGRKMAADILDNLIVLKTNKTTKEDVLKEMADAAIAAGYAKKGYYEALIEREKKYPTGLHIPDIEVAIPHADAEWAIKPSVTIGILEKPVVFEPMGEEGGPVNVELVFMLTIEDPKEHIDFLRAFTTLMSDTALLIDLSKSGDPTKVIELIRKGIPDRPKN